MVIQLSQTDEKEETSIDGIENEISSNGCCLAIIELLFIITNKTFSVGTGSLAFVY